MNPATAHPEPSAATPQGPAHPVPTPSEDYLSLISHDFARGHLVLSAGTEDDRERLLIGPSTDPLAAHNAGVRLGRAVKTVEADPEQLARWIDEAYAARERSVEIEQAGDSSADRALDTLLALSDRDLLSTEGKGPVVKLVDALLFEALGLGASDLHIQPLADRTLVRFRVDGVLHVARELPVSVTLAVVSRIKVMGRMDIAERRVPQDGRATVSIGRAANGGTGSGGAGRAIDLRISSLPTSFGERVVIRLLDTDRGTAMQSFDSLGMPADIEPAYLQRAARANGLILLTGPTGSGKTTTLYTTLRWIAARGGGELNVMTIEDPIEYELSSAGVAISQAQVNTRKGITFASGLRHILRQDPDVVMVGEIRDTETARIAIQSSLTGHLVFSTLHTNDASSAVTRLVDLGIEPYLVGSSLSAVLAQRLVRKVHPGCGGSGCKACLGSGFLGRTGLFELLVVTETMRHEIAGGASASTIRELARSGGMRTLHEDGGRLLGLGLTSRDEVERVTVDLDDRGGNP